MFLRLTVLANQSVNVQPWITKAAGWPQSTRLLLAVSRQKSFDKRSIGVARAEFGIRKNLAMQRDCRVHALHDEHTQRT